MNRYRDFNWGAPFARSWPDGSTTFGARLLLSSQLISPGNGGAIGFIGALVNSLGGNARTMAQELVPQVGGTILDGSDPQHRIHLQAALMNS